MSFQSLRNCLQPGIAVYGVIAIAVVCYILTIRPGHNWGGDFALYIEHAANLAEGRDFADTVFVYNTKDPFLSPRSYPPVYPAYLAPVYRIFGLNLYALKIANILSFAVFLLVFNHYAASRLDFPLTRILLVAGVAFSPWYWDAKDRILPDFLFILILYASIMMLDRMSVARGSGGSRYLPGVAGGVLVSLLYGTRSLGMLMVPALWLHDLVRYRLVSRATMLVTIIFMIFYLTQNAFLQTDQSYINSLKTLWAEEQEVGVVTAADDAGGGGVIAVMGNSISMLADRLSEKLRYYGGLLGTYWYPGSNAYIGVVVLALATVLAVAAFISLMLKSPSVGDYFVLTYVGVLLVVPFSQQRYLLPLLPLYLLYIFHAAERIGRMAGSSTFSLNAGIYRAAPVIVGVFVAASYAWSWSLLDSSDIERGVESKESKELFGFIRKSIPTDSLLIFHKPRPLALFTGRHATRYHWELDGDKLWRELLDMGATHIVMPKYIDPAEHSEYFFPATVEAHRGNLEKLYENRNFIVYRILPG